MKKIAFYLLKFTMAWILHPKNCFVQLIELLPFRINALDFVRRYPSPVEARPSQDVQNMDNPLREYIDNYTEGAGIWKWEHYIDDVYHRHLSKFVGRKVNIVEIGIYSGGSLEMWRSYFGNQCHVYGIDIEDACKAYENEYTSIYIGDQAKRAFWQKFRQKVPIIDIVIDDGGHTPEQQRVTLEETLPYISDGGVFICEDIYGRRNRFSAYASTLVEELNHKIINKVERSKFQRSVHSVHFYPFCLVIEKHEVEPQPFHSPRRGTQWQPFDPKARSS